ncbi:MAG: AAA family ATPase [Deltaproteobacteria bacterium]|nr:MAG: AAA family ATPase [Deltaproteobacteria bacterium]
MDDTKGPVAHGATDDAAIVARLGTAAARLSERFLGKEEVIRLMFVSVLAGEHMVMIGPPGTAKSALVRSFARVVDARYFDYLLTRFTEPNEIFGPVDIKAFREGVYRRRTEGMLPEAEIVFLDEIFKANSAILNSLLSLLNARMFMHGTHRIKVPLLSLFAASNEVPSDEALAALFDRFSLRVQVDYLDSYHFRGLLQKGSRLEAEAMDDDDGLSPVVAAADVRHLQRKLAGRLDFDEDFLTTFKSLVFQMRSEGVGLSDRRVVKLLKLFAASAMLDGRDRVDTSDLFVLRHVWNTPEQRELLAEIVGPVLDRWYDEHPDSTRVGVTPTNLDDLLEELAALRKALAAADVLSDMQLFSYLRNLGDIKAALERMQDNPAAARMVGEVDKLLESVFASGRFA